MVVISVGRAFVVPVLIAAALAAAAGAAPALAPIPSRVWVGYPRGLVLSSLVPRDAQLNDARPIPAAEGVPPEEVVTWFRPVSRGVETGLAIWQRERDAVHWRRIVLVRGASDVEAIRFQLGDFTGDRHPDVLLFEDTDGSGGCGMYRAFASVAGRTRELLVRRTCADLSAMWLGRGSIVIRTGVGKDPATRDQIHCCPLWVRETQLRWDGRRLVLIRSRHLPASARRQPLGTFP